MNYFKTRIASLPGLSGLKAILVSSDKLRTVTICMTFKFGIINDGKGNSGITNVIFQYFNLIHSTEFDYINVNSLNYSMQIGREYSTITIECNESQYLDNVERLSKIFANFYKDEQKLELARKITIHHNNVENDNIVTSLDRIAHLSIFLRQRLSSMKDTNKMYKIDMNKIEEHYQKFFNHKSIFITIASSMNNKTVLSSLENLQPYNYPQGMFISFKKLFNKPGRSKQKSWSSEMLHFVIVYPTYGIRDFYNYLLVVLSIYLLRKFIKIILGEFSTNYVDITHSVYNKLSVVSLYFVLSPDEIDMMHKIICLLSKINISDDLIKKAIQSYLNELKNNLLSSSFVAKDIALHYLHLKKIKDYDLIVAVINSVDKVSLDKIIKDMFDTNEVSVFAMGNKMKKRLFRVLNNEV